MPEVAPAMAYGFRGNVVHLVMADDAIDTALARFREFYDTFSAATAPAWLDRLPEMYAPNFAFEDPFHHVNGDIAKLRSYFARVAKLPVSKFVVEDMARGSDGAYVRWRWEWKLRGRGELRVVPGVTHLRFADNGAITHHRDLFDAARGFYEALPVVGRVLGAIRKRV
jgi:steroid delta-isomerase